MIREIIVLLPAFSLILCHDNKVIVDNFGGDCSADSLAVYKVTLEGHWSRELFPKHFPENRPSAHFSKSFGISHNSSFNLFTVDQIASSGLKEFCESTDTNEWENEEIDGELVFDEFIIPKLSNPLDKIESRLFVQSNYSLISMVTKLIPSPDWFIGIESLQVS